MSSKYIRTDMVYAWPTAEVAVMGADGAVNILYAKQLREEGLTAEARAELVAQFRDKFAKPYNVAASGHVDEILVPSETRSHLELLRDKKVQTRAKKHGNIPL